MSFTSFSFLAFVVITAAAYYIAPKGSQWLVLLAASVVFYLSFSVGGIFVLTFTALLAWFAAWRIDANNQAKSAWVAANKAVVDRSALKAKKAAFDKKNRMISLLFSAAAIGALFLCKYYGPLAGDVNRLTGLKLWTAEGILLPLGISYYSLQLISYVLDISRGIIRAEKNPLKVMLFGGFFLSVLQGPFNRYGTLMPQLSRTDRPAPRFDRIRSAGQRMLLGYIKKLCIADQMAVIVNEVYGSPELYSGTAVLLAVLCYAIQLYADFSGYMDIVLGFGELLGLELPENFRQPFFAGSISEFWQKWHITLGAWLKDYVFYPLLKSAPFQAMGKRLSARFGKNVGRSLPTYLGMLILWTLIGLWHGAGFHYVFSVGLLQFLYILLGMLCEPLFKRLRGLFRIRADSMWFRVFRALRTTALMIFAWVFFRAESFRAGLVMLRRIVTGPFAGGVKLLFNQKSSALLDQNAIIWLAYVLGCLVFLLSVDLLHERGVRIRERICAMHVIPRTALYLAAAAALLVFGAYGSQYIASNFIYFEF